MLFAVFGRRKLFFLTEQLRKIKGIFIADRPCDCGHREICARKIPTGFFHPDIKQMLLGRAPGCFLENAVQIGSADIQAVGELLDADIVFIVQFHVFERFPHAGAPPPFGGKLCLRELFGKKEQVFIQRAVHCHIGVGAEAACKIHFVVSNADTVVPVIAEHRMLKQGSTGKIVLDFDTLKTDPGIHPRVVLIGLVTDQFPRHNQKRVALADGIGFATGAVNALTAGDVMDHIAAPCNRPIAVPGGAFLTPAGIDNGIVSVVNFIEENIVLHLWPSIPYKISCKGYISLCPL